MKQLEVLANHEMLSLQPNDAYSDSSAATPVLKLICPGLLSIDSQGGLTPALATKWSMEEGGRLFRFKLQRDVVFSNGEKVTANVAAASVVRSLQPQRNSLHDQDLGLVSDVIPEGDSQILIKTREPFPMLPWYLAWRHYVVPDTELQPVGVGPYKLRHWTRGAGVVLERNERYTLGNVPYFDVINIKFAPSSEERLEAARSGHFDYIESIPASLQEDVGFGEQYEVIPVNSGSRTVLAFNTRREALRTKAQREQVINAISIAELNDRIFGQSLHDDTINEPFAQTVFSNLNLSLFGPNIWPVDEVATELQRQLHLSGIRVNVGLYTDPPWWPLIYPSLSEPQWDLAIQSMPARPVPEIQLRREYRSTGPFNSTGLVNRQLDLLIDALQCELSTKRREEHTQAAYELAESEIMYHELYKSHYSIGIRKGLQGVEAHPMGFWPLNNLRK